MSVPLYDLRVGDTLTTVRSSVVDKYTKQRLSLSGTHTARIKFQVDNGTVFDQPMTVLSGTDDGVVEYQFQAGEVTLGTMKIQIQITEISTGFIVVSINEICKEVGPSL